MAGCEAGMCVYCSNEPAIRLGGAKARNVAPHGFVTRNCDWKIPSKQFLPFISTILKLDQGEGYSSVHQGWLDDTDVLIYEEFHLTQPQKQVLYMSKE